MGKTFKDEPYWVQGYRLLGRRPRNDYRSLSDLNYTFGHLKRWETITWDMVKEYHYHFRRRADGSWEKIYKDKPHDWKDYDVFRYPPEFYSSQDYKDWLEETDEPHKAWRQNYMHGRRRCWCCEDGYKRDTGAYRAYVRDMIAHERYDDIESYKVRHW